MKKALTTLAAGLVVASFIGCKKAEPETAPAPASQQMEAPAQPENAAAPAPEAQNPAENEGK